MNIFSPKKILVLIVITLSCYAIYWTAISLILKSQINSNINHINGLIYDDISISGFPYKIQTNINDLQIVDFKKGDSLKIPNIKINMNPFDLKNILVRFDKLRIKISQENMNIKSSIKEVRGLINLDNSSLFSASFLINSGSMTVNNIKVGEMSQTKFDMIKEKKDMYKFNALVQSTNLPLIKKKDIKVELNGKSRINKKNVNGSFQITAKLNSTDEKIFEFPVNIKNNKAYMLFIPIFDLDKLFRFF